MVLSWNSARFLHGPAGQSETGSLDHEMPVRKTLPGGPPSSKMRLTGEADGCCLRKTNRYCVRVG
jgi:hypothetical protein